MSAEHGKTPKKKKKSVSSRAQLFDTEFTISKPLNFFGTTLLRSRSLAFEFRFSGTLSRSRFESRFYYFNSRPRGKTRRIQMSYVRVPESEIRKIRARWTEEKWQSGNRQLQYRKRSAGRASKTKHFQRVFRPNGALSVAVRPRHDAVTSNGDRWRLRTKKILRACKFAYCTNTHTCCA